MKKIKVLFCCMGNICRSPTAHGVFEHLVNQHQLADMIEIDSAGTHAYHVGESPDRRSQSTANKRGYDLGYIRARKVEAEDFHAFDYVLAMDHENYRNLTQICPAEMNNKLRMFLDFAQNFDEREVPDPYYGGANGFEHVLDLIEDASEGLLNNIKHHHL
ncbi:MAG: low molecular weight phosphotyrosine protein phosphatase [Gammaproteobacteria bacterium]|nr:low molecular weight phosphotyrosine protein phosphatase [Gammaproteobacteria bacterium]